MSATLGYSQLKFERIGVKTTVPNNDVAKLMYYLSCVLNVIKYEQQNSKLTDYANYYNLNEEEKDVLLSLVLLFNPAIFLEAKIFLVAPSLLTNNNANDFFKITDERIGIHVSEQIMIGGKSVKVMKIMVCSQSWLEKYYFIPFKNCLEEKNNERNNVAIYSSRNISSRNEINDKSNGIINQRNSNDSNRLYNSNHYDNQSLRNNPATDYGTIYIREKCKSCGSTSSPEYSEGCNGARCWCYTILLVYLCPFF